MNGVSKVSSPGVLNIVRGHLRSIAAAVFLALLSSGLGLAQPLVVKRVIDATRRGPVAWGLIGVLLLLFVGQASFEALSRYMLGRTGEGVILGIRLKLIGHLLRLHMSIYDKQRIGDLLSRAGTDGLALRRVVVDGFSNVAAASIGIFGATALMIWLDWQLFLLVAVCVVSAVLLFIVLVPRIRAASMGSQQSVGQMTADLERALTAIRTVRASHGEERETERIGSEARAVYRHGVKMAKLEAVMAPASALAVTGSFLVVLLIGGLHVAKGKSSIGNLVAFMLYVIYLLGPIGSAFDALTAIQQGTGAIRRINEVFDLPLEHGDAPANGRVTRRRQTGHPILELRDVWFSYEPARPVLRGVSLEVADRRQISLIGRSGSGKSTIFALVERFYDPDRGRILFEGRDIRALSPHEYRARVGLVEQHTPVMYGTLRENITYSVPDASAKEIRRVLELSNLGELVARLPEGLDTDVGEHGCLLSGGERQRIAIARALLPRPKLLLLDEPTAHLDSVSEEALRIAIRHVATECALLVIAHRYSTIRSGDQIVVLDGGKVVAVGTDEALLSSSRHYRSLALASLSPKAAPSTRNGSEGPRLRRTTRKSNNSS